MGDFPVFMSTYQCFSFVCYLVEEGLKSGCLVVWQLTKVTHLLLKKWLFHWFDFNLFMISKRACLDLTIMLR